VRFTFKQEFPNFGFVLQTILQIVSNHSISTPIVRNDGKNSESFRKKLRCSIFTTFDIFPTILDKFIKFKNGTFNQSHESWKTWVYIGKNAEEKVSGQTFFSKILMFVWEFQKDCQILINKWIERHWNGLQNYLFDQEFVLISKLKNHPFTQSRKVVWRCDWIELKTINNPLIRLENNCEKDEVTWYGIHSFIDSFCHWN
jgi:hypothetical protein